MDRIVFKNEYKFKWKDSNERSKFLNKRRSRILSYLKTDYREIYNKLSLRAEKELGFSRFEREKGV